jgi:hypothetical protein
MVDSGQLLRTIKDRLNPIFEGVLKAVSFLSIFLMLIGLGMIYLYLAENDVVKYFGRFLSQTNLLLMVALNSLFTAMALLALFFYLPLSLIYMKSDDCFSWKRRSLPRAVIFNATYAWIPMGIITLILWVNIRDVEWSLMLIGMAALNTYIYYKHRHGPDIDSLPQKLKHQFLLFIMMIIFCLVLFISFSFVVKMFSLKIEGDAYQWGALFAFVIVYGFIVGHVTTTRELKTPFWTAIAFSLALLVFIRGEWSAVAFSGLRLGAYNASYLVDKQVVKLIPNISDYTVHHLDGEPYVVLHNVWTVLSVDDLVVIKSDRKSSSAYHIPVRFYIDEVPSESSVKKTMK